MSDTHVFTLPTLPDRYAEVPDDYEWEFSIAHLTECAERGAAMLDDAVPGWHTHIDLQRLDMGKGRKATPLSAGCVLCQLDYAREKAAANSDQPLDRGIVGNYHEAVDTLFGEEERQIAQRYYGFNLSFDGLYRWEELEAFRFLNGAWHTLIEERQQADASQADAS